MTRNRLTWILPLVLLVVVALAGLTLPLVSAAAPEIDRVLAQEFTATSGVAFPTLEPRTATPEFCLTPLDFKVGDTVVLIPGISVRTGPSPDTPLIIQYNDRREFTIVGGPICVDGFNYWNIAGHRINGWVAEGRGTAYWLSLVRRAGEPVTPCLTPLKLVVGERFELLNNIRIRADPTLAGLTRTIVPAASSVVVLGGPECADGYNWWNVRAVVLGVTYEGWMAEADRFGEAFVDVPPEGDGTVCDSPLYLDIGDRVRVTYTDNQPKNLRNAPDTSAAVMYELLKNTPMVIIGGPLCADSYNWWQVRVLASSEVVGWMAEGGPAQYWIARVELPGDGLP